MSQNKEEKNGLEIDGFPISYFMEEVDEVSTAKPVKRPENQITNLEKSKEKNFNYAFEEQHKLSNDLIKNLLEVIEDWNPIHEQRRQIEKWFALATKKSFFEQSVERGDGGYLSGVLAKAYLVNSRKTINGVITEIEKIEAEEIDISYFVNILESDFVSKIRKDFDNKTNTMEIEDVCEWIADFEKKWSEHKEKLHEEQILRLKAKIESIINAENQGVTIVDSENLHKQITQEVHSIHDDSEKLIEDELPYLPYDAQQLIEKCPMLLEWRGTKNEMYQREILERDRETNKFESVKIWLARELRNSGIIKPILIKELRKINPKLAHAINDFKKKDKRAFETMIV